jgi:hypothetical protein
MRIAQPLKSHQGFNLTSVEDGARGLHGRRDFGCRRFSFEFERRRHRFHPRNAT